jgi:hypothetical protein
VLIHQSVLIQPVRRRARRAGVLAVALGAAWAVLTGCGSGPSQAGAAAIVGSSAVSLADVQARIDTVLGRPDVMANLAARGNAPAGIARFIVAEEVQHLLLAEAARRDQIGVSDQQVDAELAKPDTVDMLQGAKLVFDPARQREAVRDELIAEALTAKYLNRLVVTVDVTTATSKEEARRKARLLASGPQQANAVFVADGQNAQRNVQLRAAQVPQSAALFLFGTPAGQVVATQTGSSPDVWTLVRFTQRSVAGPPQGDPAAASAAQLGVQTADQIGRRFTQPLSEELGVRVNPRYGTWDPLYLNVVPPGQDSSLVLTSATG